MSEIDKHRAPSLWQALRNIGVLPFGLSAILGAPSYLDILAYFFDDLHYGVIVERMLDNWRLINKAIVEIISPLTDKLMTWVQLIKPDLVLSDIWLSFFWIMIIPCFAAFRGLASQSSLKLDTSFGTKLMFAVFFGIPTFLMSFIAGIVPNSESILGQIFQSIAPVLALPFAMFVSFFLISLLAALFLILFGSRRSTLKIRLLTAKDRFISSLSHVVPGPSAFVLPLKLSLVLGSVTALLSYIKYPENRPALFVYFCALLLLGIFLLYKKPIKSVDAKSDNKISYSDVRPIGGLILGGGVAAALIVSGEYLITYALKGILP